MPVIPRAFCADRSEALGEDAAGTASTVRAFLLIEHGGPWGVSALRDAAFPAGLSRELQARCAPAGIRPMLMRRHGARPGLPPRPRVVLAACRPAGGTAAMTQLGDVRDVLDLSLPDLLAELAQGETPAGWSPVPAFFGTCTHGRHDACCAERGRPVAKALHETAGDTAWEVSHMGGDRFAGNVLALPDGIYYGRVTEDRVAGLVSAHAGGRLLPDLMRGRSSLPFAAQAAEIALRRALGIEEAAALRLLTCRRVEDRTTTRWQVQGRGDWRVVVDTTRPGPERHLTCTSAVAVPPQHTIVELVSADAPGRGAEGWDAAYAGATDDAEPSAVVTEVLAPLPPGRAVDVGAGTGRHALWLAARGWGVTAVDFSAVAVDLGRRASASPGLDVDWQLGDARLWSPPDASSGYDLVLLAYVSLPEVLRRAAGWLAPGGRLVVVGHSVRNLAEGSGHGPRDPRLLHTLDGLRHSAAGLEVERLEEVVTASPRGRVVETVLVARRG